MHLETRRGAVRPRQRARRARPRTAPRTTRRAGTRSSSAAPTATFFHRVGWRDILEDVLSAPARTTWWRSGAARSSACCRWPRCSSRLFGHALVSLPFCVYGGAAADDAEAVHGAGRRRPRRSRATLGVEHLELRNRASVVPEWPQQDLYVTFRKEILPDVEANMLAIPRKQRAMVRKGIKNGLRERDRRRTSSASSRSTPTTCTATARRRSRGATSSALLRDVRRRLRGADRRRPATGSRCPRVLIFYFRDEVLPYYAGDCVDARATWRPTTSSTGN